VFAHESVRGERADAITVEDESRAVIANEGRPDDFDVVGG
jgi:hypothetical protein